MNNLNKLTNFIGKYLPMFFLLCFSGNPIITTEAYSKIALIGYTFLFIIYTLFIVDLRMLKNASGILIAVLVLIATLVFFQRISLGFVSYPGVLGYFLKIVLGLSTLLLYQYKKIDFIDIYIKLMSFLSIVSIPFWILNQFGFYGLQLESIRRKSFFIYTTLLRYEGRIVVRNSGMFWEPGAFAGYLILALLFIAIKNRKFQIGPYWKDALLILTGLLTTMSTTGFIAFGFILVMYSLQNYRWGKIIVVPVLAMVINFAYFKLDFMREKIETQYALATEMDENDVSATRMGALRMDLQYIESQPLTGNGFHLKTRYRLHPWIKEDINQGNGMSNIMAIWGVPFFLFWLYCVYRFARNISRSMVTSLAIVFIIILVLQGEQYLNYPLFLTFFFLPFVYKDILTEKNKIHLIKTYFKS